MFSNKTALAGLFALSLVGVAHAQEKHLTLDDIDGLAREQIVKSMSKAPASTATNGVGLSAPIAAPVTAPAETPAPPRKPAPPVKRTIPVTFVGAYTDTSGKYVLYDYQGAIYPAKQGATLLNGWVFGRVDGFVVSLSEGKRKWTEVIAAQSQSAAIDSPGIQVINDLNSPLPLGGPIPPQMIGPMAGANIGPVAGASGGKPIFVPVRN
jgi:hypothetical protein